jgi:cytoskeletal protein RodZ
MDKKKLTIIICAVLMSLGVAGIAGTLYYEKTKSTNNTVQIQDLRNNNQNNSSTSTNNSTDSSSSSTSTTTSTSASQMADTSTNVAKGQMPNGNMGGTPPDMNNSGTTNSTDGTTNNTMPTMPDGNFGNRGGMNMQKNSMSTLDIVIIAVSSLLLTGSFTYLVMSEYGKINFKDFMKRKKRMIWSIVETVCVSGLLATTIILLANTYLL